MIKGYASNGEYSELISLCCGAELSCDKDGFKCEDCEIRPCHTTYRVNAVFPSREKWQKVLRDLLKNNYFNPPT